MTLTRDKLRELCEQTENIVGDVLIASDELYQFLNKHGCIINFISAETFRERAPDIYAEAQKFGDKFSFTTIAIYTFALAEILYKRIK